MLRPNTTAIVKINDFARKDAVAAPSHLIQKSTTGENFVYLVRKKGDKDIVEKVDITIGKSYRGKTLITSGLQPGDKIIHRGYNEVIHGQEVNLVQVDKQAV